MLLRMISVCDWPFCKVRLVANRLIEHVPNSNDKFVERRARWGLRGNVAELQRLLKQSLNL